MDLARQIEEARLRENAIEQLLKGGSRARQHYANNEAIQHYRRALAPFEETPPEEFPAALQRDVVTRLHEGLGDVPLLTGQPQEARAVYEGALVQVSEDNPIWQSRLYRKIGKTYERQHRHEKALRAYALAETIPGKEPAKLVEDWWREWITIQEARMSRSLLADSGSASAANSMPELVGVEPRSTRATPLCSSSASNGGPVYTFWGS